MPIIAKGLDGVVVDETAVSQVTSETSSLIYRGYRAQDLADQCTFEEVAYLMLTGELPTRAQLDDFMKNGRPHRPLSPSLLEVIQKIPKTAHPMDMVRTGVSWLGMEEQDSLHIDLPRARQIAAKLLAKIPTIVAATYRARKGQPIIAPRQELRYSENFFNMCFGKVHDAEVFKAFDVSMDFY